MGYVFLGEIIIFIILAFILGGRAGKGLSIKTALKCIEEQKRREKELECSYFNDTDDNDNLTLEDLETLLSDEKSDEESEHEDGDFDLDSDWEEDDNDFLVASNSSSAASDLSCLKLGQEYCFGTKTISVSRRNGYTEYPIAGIRFRGLSLTDIGRFEGYARAETDNEYDDYAVSVFREDYTRLGYIPLEIFSYIVIF